MTNEICKCGHVKGSHGYSGYSDGSSDVGKGECRNSDCPCKKFKPQNQTPPMSRKNGEKVAGNIFDTTDFNSNDEVCNYPNCKKRTRRTTNRWKNHFCLNHMYTLRGASNKVVYKNIKTMLFLERQRLKAEVEKILDDETWYERVCKKCGRQWGSLHCQHDGVQGTCPNCNTRGAQNLQGECNCEFTVKVEELKKRLGI